MDLSSLSAIAPGFIQGQQNALALKRKQEEAAAIERQKTADTILAGSLIGDLGSLSPAPPGGPAPVPQGAGQPSVASPQQVQQGIDQGMRQAKSVTWGPGGMQAAPDQSLGGVAQPTPPGAPPPGYPMQQAQPRPQMAAMPQGQPSQAGPQPGPGGGAPQGAGGMMSLEQMAQHIMAAPGNRGIDWRKPQNAQALLMALEKNQQLLAPQAKAELAAAKQDLAAAALAAKIEDAQRKIELGQMKIDSAEKLAEVKNQFAMQMLQMKESGLDRRKSDELSEKFNGLLAIIAGRKDLQGDKDNAAGTRLDKTLSSKERIATGAQAVKKELGDAKNLNDAKKIESTDWYRTRQTELKEQQLSDAAVKAQMDHEVKLIQEEGRNSRNTANLASKEGVAAAALAVKKELGEGALQLGNDKLAQTKFFQQRSLDLKEQGLSDAAIKVQLNHEMEQVKEEGRNTRAAGAEAGRNQRAEMSDATRRELSGMSNETRRYIADMQDTTKRATAQASETVKRDLAKASDETKRWVTSLQEEGRDNRTTQVEAGKTAALTEKGREADQAEGGRNARAKATLEKAGSTVFSDETAQFLAESMRTDPSIISHIGSGQSANANKQKILAAYAKLPGVDPSSLAEAKVALQGSSSEARKVGTQAGSVLLGTKEIEEFAPLVLSAAKKVDATKYPTVNAMVQATQRGTGEPEIVTLVNNIQALKSAYTQILTRGGVPGVEAQKRADELISPTMAPAQIEAAVAAMKAEGAGAGRAATKAGKVVSSKAGGRETAPATAAPEEADPLGILK